jgi:hypothetical protein
MTYYCFDFDDYDPRDDAPPERLVPDAFLVELAAHARTLGILADGFTNAVEVPAADAPNATALDRAHARGCGVAYRTAADQLTTILESLEDQEP